MTVNQRDIVALYFTVKSADLGGLSPETYEDDMKTFIEIYNYFRKRTEEADCEVLNACNY